MGMIINLTNRPTSTPIKIQNRILLPKELNHKKYSKKTMMRKYRKPIAKNKMAPFKSSLI